MTKRYIVATFINGATNERTTTNANLRYGWRVLSGTGTTIIQGFSSDDVIPPDARAALKNYPNSSFQNVEVVVTEKPKPVKITRSSTKTLRNELLQALVTYAAQNGRRWKIRLAGEWERATASPALMEVRNAFGPSWLQGFRLPK